MDRAGVLFIILSRWLLSCDKFNEIQIAWGIPQGEQVLPHFTAMMGSVIYDVFDDVPEGPGTKARSGPAVKHCASRLLVAEGLDIAFQSQIFLFPVCPQPCQLRELLLGQFMQGKLTFLAAKAPVPLRVDDVDESPQHATLAQPAGSMQLLWAEMGSASQHALVCPGIIFYES